MGRRCVSGQAPSALRAAKEPLLGRILKSAIVVGFSLVLVKCTGPDGSVGGPPGVPLRGRSQAVLFITATNTAFDGDKFSLPSDEAFVIDMRNDDVGVGHTISVYEPDGVTAIVRGEVVHGPGSVRYQMPPLRPGVYPFRCDVHPQQMTGVLSVVPRP